MQTKEYNILQLLNRKSKEKKQKKITQIKIILRSAILITGMIMVHLLVVKQSIVVTLKRG